MTRSCFLLALASCAALALSAGSIAPPAWAHSSDADAHGHQQRMIETMREQHRDHDHEYHFEAMEEMSAEDMAHMVELMRGVGLALPPMDPARGRELFVETGCIVCHAVNGIGGEIGPSLNAADMPSPMNAFEFAARMWRGAAAMTVMQEAEFGGVIELTGQDLADLVAFAHDADEQAKLTADEIPERFRRMMGE